ncbi:fungal pheromone STE3G-protein-coupled receptor [Peniophora sp. CONT]|nr:fungal pheromone STE3G-protein-coupled receptor [Peniophora sp. CONT]
MTAKMAAVDPTYPLYPLACILASICVFSVLLNSFVRQSWNLGVTFLCFWLLIENMAGAINTIVWSDNADVRFYIYCDIVSHVAVVTHVVKPLATLIITRRLYLIASLRSVELPSEAMRRWDLAVEWTLGLVLPILVAGPIYYVNQGGRFQVIEGFGCTNGSLGSILYILILQSWAIIPPLLSVTVYYPRITWTFYRQRREINQFLHSSGSVTSTMYLRILALASFDILLTLPIGIVNVVLSVVSDLVRGDFPFYNGWAHVHENWGPVSVPYANLEALGPSILGQLYFTYWTSPVLAFAIFGLFGLAAEARASYWRIICKIGGWFRCIPNAPGQKASPPLSSIVFVAPTQVAVSIDAETRYVSSLSDGCS